MSTNKNIVVILVALVLLGVAGVAFSETGLKFSNPFSKNLHFNTVQDAVNYGKSLKCELIQNLPGQTNRITIYTQNGNIKEEVNTAAGTLHVLITTDYTYMWGTQAPGVAKILAQQAQKSNALILGTPIPNYRCTEQTSHPGQFSPPR
jgi:hypothetical protein